MIPAIFADQPVFIVGGGPSLAGFDFAKLAGKNTIAVNRAYESVPDASLLWWTDYRFWLQHKEALTGHGAPWKATADWDYAEPGRELPACAQIYKFTGAHGLEMRPGHLRHGNNSGFTCMNLAAQLGARLIILLGIDMQYDAKRRSHYHDGHGRQHYEKTLRETMLPFFASLVIPLAQNQIHVINASPNSALRVWPRCSIQEGLLAYERFSLSRRP